MRDYYEAHPMRMPRIPIALIGFFGARQDVVGAKLAALTGLPCADVTNLMIHRAGAAPARVLLERGPEAYHELARECLSIALTGEPPGVVSLPQDILLDDGDRQTVLAKSALVYLHLDFETIYRRVVGMVEERPGVFFPWVTPEKVCANDLERMFEERRAGYDDAMIHIDATEREPVDVAREIIEQFELWRDDGPSD